MGKRQRTYTSEDADGSCKGKRLSSEHGRPASAITSPLLSFSESSQSDSEVDIVWGHSPPPLNLNLHSTPGPKTRRKSDYTNKDIADMIECIHSRNSSQQSPTISTPPLLGLWMQGRQDVDRTPASAKGQRLPRKLPSRKPSNEAWASLAKDLHMLAEASKDFPLSQQATNEVQNEDVIACPVDENLQENGVPDCQIDSSVTPKRCPPNQSDAAREDSPMPELWGDDSWFETDSIVRIATQLEQEASNNVKGACTDPHKTARGNSIPQKLETSSRSFEKNEDRTGNKGFKSAMRNTNPSLTDHSEHQFTSPPNCRRLSTKQMFQTSSESISKQENPNKGRASFRFTISKDSSGVKMEEPRQFSKQSTHVREGNSSRHDKIGNTQNKEASFVTMTGKSQFAKSSKHVSSSVSTHTHPDVSSTSLATNLKRVDASSKRTASLNRVFEPAEKSLSDCNESMDLFESSVADEEVEKKVQVQENSRKKEGHMNFQNAGKGALPLDKGNTFEGDISSDLSFIDEELLAAVEKEEMQWEEISSQQVDEVVKTSRASCTDQRLGYEHSFTVPYPKKNAGSFAPESTLKETPPILCKKVQPSQFSFKSSQKNSQNGVKQVMAETAGAKNTDNPLSYQQIRSPVSSIVNQNNRMNQSGADHVNQFLVASGNKVIGKQFERTKVTKFSASQTVQFQPSKSTAKMENSSTIHREKHVPPASNSKVSRPSSTFKTPVASQFVKSSTAGNHKDSIPRSCSTSSFAISEKEITGVTQIKPQASKLLKSSNDSISLAKKANPATTGTPTCYPVSGSLGEEVPETLSTNGNNAVLPPKESRNSFQLNGNLPDKKTCGQTKSAPLSQFSSRSKNTKSEKTFSSSVTHSRISLRDENKADTCSISRNFGVLASNHFQTKASHINSQSVKQATSNTDLNSSAFSHVSSQFSSSSQIKCYNDTSSQVTPSPIFTTNAVRPPFISDQATIPQPPETSTSVFSGHSMDHPRSELRKGNEKGAFSAGTLNSRNVLNSQFSQFSKAKKDHSVLVDPSGENILTCGDVLKEEASVCSSQSTKAKLKEAVAQSNSPLPGTSHMSKGQKISSQFAKTGDAQVQSSSQAITTKSVLTTVTNVFVNDAKPPVVPGYNTKQFSCVTGTSSVPFNGECVSFQKDTTEGTETRKNFDFKSCQKGGAQGNLNTTTVKTLHGNSSECVVKTQKQLLQTRTGTLTTVSSQDKKTCSQEQIEQKRRVALARKKQREKLVGNHTMNLRERTVLKK